MNVLDLFSGIGGFSLGLERAGMRTVAFCEIDPYCRAVLAQRWPGIPCYEDIRELTAARLAADGISVDLICGGFPCQDISGAGKGAGITGARSGLWTEYARLISELRPDYVIVENVSALLARGLGTVLGELASIRYDAEWHCIPACAVGAPHRRDRVWIVAHPNGDELRNESRRRRGSRRTGAAEPDDNGTSQLVAYTDSRRLQEQRESQHGEQQRSLRSELDGRGARRSGAEPTVADSNESHELRGRSSLQMGWGRLAREVARDGHFAGAEWSSEPDVGRVAHGVSSRVDRLGALGNAVVPQIPEIIGRAILAWEQQR